MTYAGVAISGKAGAGKNAFARILAALLAERGQWATEINFADGLKAELLELYGMTKEDPGGRDKLVELGHGRRQADPLYWVKVLERRVESLKPYGLIPIITDVRYLNELEYARRARFVTVRIDATVADRSVVLGQRGEDPAFATSEHPSECELDEERFDIRFANPHSEYGQLDRAAFYAADMLGGLVELVA